MLGLAILAVVLVLLFHPSKKIDDAIDRMKTWAGVEEYDEQTEDE